MKIRLLLVTLICAVATMPGVRAQEGAKEPQTELGARMEKMNGAFRKLRAQIKDATKNEDSLAQVAILKDNATQALKFEPARKATVPADGQAKFVTDFQEKLKATIAHIDQIAAALKAGDNAAASAAFDLVAADQKEGHKDFKAAPKKKM